MSGSADVPAAVVAVNVKPQRLSGDESLMTRVPLRCSAESLEWSGKMYTKRGAADAVNHIGDPVPIILQQQNTKQK